MSRRIEIQPEPRGMARVETFVGTKLTSVSEPLPLEAARERAVSLMGSSGFIVDHTVSQFAPVSNKRVSFDLSRFRA